jgi:hypothetical protein
MGQDTTPYEPDSYQQAVRQHAEAQAKAEHDVKVEALAREIFLRQPVDLDVSISELADAALHCRAMALIFYSDRAQFNDFDREAIASKIPDRRST